MSRNKYIKDYELDRYLDDKGRIRSTPRYVGAYYGFSASAESVRKDRTVMTVVCLAAWVAFIVSVIPRTFVMHLPFVSLPIAFSLVPLWLESTGVVAAYTVKSVFDHKTSVKLGKRYAVASVLFFAFGMAAAIGCAVAAFVFRASLVPADAAVFAAVCVLSVCGVFSFIKRKAFYSAEVSAKPKKPDGRPVGEAEKEDAGQ